MQIGAWRSLVARTVRDREAGGSNPLAPTNLSKNHLVICYNNSLNDYVFGVLQTIN